MPHRYFWRGLPAQVIDRRWGEKKLRLEGKVDRVILMVEW